MKTNPYLEPALWRESPLPRCLASWSTDRADAALEFGRFHVLLRRRLVADGVPVELGARTFDLLQILLEADGALVTKEELLNRVWPGLVVSRENLKVQIARLRKALGADRNLIRTEFGRGYRFIGPYCARIPPHRRAEVAGERSCGFVELRFDRAADNRSSVVSIRAGGRNQHQCSCRIFRRAGSFAD